MGHRWFGSVSRNSWKFSSKSFDYSPQKFTIFHRKAYHFAESGQGEQTSQHSSSLSAKHWTVFLPSQEPSQKAASNQDELFHFSAVGEGDSENPVISRKPFDQHPHTQRLLLTHSNLDKNKFLTIATSSPGLLSQLCLWALDKVCLPPKMPNPRVQSSGSRVTAELKLITCQTEGPESPWSQFVSEISKIYTETAALR